MASRPSEPLLALLRNALQQKGMNTAALARKVGEGRATVRNVLAGQEPLTVDQLMAWTAALELSVDDLVGLGGPEVASRLRAVDLVEPRPAPMPAGRIIVDPFGNPVEQAFRLAFGLEVDFTFVLDSTRLAGSGVPDHVLRTWPERLVIKLDAAFHAHNDPRYSAEGVSLVLSFDRLYTCTFPWEAVQQVVYNLEGVVPPPSPDGPDSDGEDEAPAGRPALRLVKG